MKKMPVILTFDVDGETLWLCRDPKNAERPVILSQGQYGPETAMPRILKVLAKHDVHATFFIPGYTVKQYPEMTRQIAAAGHEIGNHSWSHTYPDNMSGREQEEREYHDCSAIQEEVIGCRPKGYRSPAWEFSPYSIDILEKMGDIEYSSNMMNTERVRYLTINGRQSKLVEIPIHWVLDDAAFWLYSVRTPGKCMQPLSAVSEYWREEFDALLEEFQEEVEKTGDSDICFVLTCHPQIIGRPAKMKLLDRFIQHMKDSGAVEFLTGIEVATRFKETHPLDEKER